MDKRNKDKIMIKEKWVKKKRILKLATSMLMDATTFSEEGHKNIVSES